jgi:hypothetical protein
MLVALFLSEPANAQFCNGNDPNSGINTAIGCLPLEKKALTEVLLNWSVGLSGGIAFILLIIAAIQITTAQGNPKQVASGQGLLTASVMGLVLISLSVVLLNFLGVNVLGLSGLGFVL